MADINHGHAEPTRTEGDGIAYRGLGWSMVILAGVTLVCYLIVWAFFGFLQSRAAANDPVRGPLAAPATQPSIVGGRVETGTAMPPPTVLVNEPMNLHEFREGEAHILNSYGWTDKNAGLVRLPIERAMDLLLERGLPVRESR